MLQVTLTVINEAQHNTKKDLYIFLINAQEESSFSCLPNRKRLLSQKSLLIITNKTSDIPHYLSHPTHLAGTYSKNCYLSFLTENIAAALATTSLLISISITSPPFKICSRN